MITRQHLLFFLIIGTAIYSCTESAKNTDETPPQDNQAFDQMLVDYQEQRLTFNPLEATFSGDNRFNDQLPNFLTQDYRDRSDAFIDGFSEQLHTFDREQLAPSQKVSYDILEWEFGLQQSGRDFPAHLLPINQFSALHLSIGQLAGGTSAQPFESIKDYDNWLGRLNGFVAWCDTAMVNMQIGMEKGYVLPKALAAKVIPQMAGFATGSVEDHVFYAPVKNMIGDFPTAEKERIAAEYREMVGEKIIPTFDRLHQFFANEYLPACRESSGINEVPGGRAYYDQQIKLFTTTTMSADEIHELGLREVARLEGEMEEVKAQVGFDGDLKAFFDHVRTRPELMPFDDPQGVIDNFNAIHEKMKPQLEQLFDLTPKTAFEVRRTEAFREASASAEYMQGSTDGTRPGIFYVPIPDVTKYNIFTDEDLFLHEAIPGHHYQISLQQEDENLPDFRRTLWYSSYGEGWALYCESLGKELGLYDDPYQYFGMLSAEMHRAIRLVVDTGIHTKGWSREKAIQYSLDHEAEPEASIIAEIERYMSWPGQALSYKIGQLKIRELRQRATEAFGDDFDIKQFHNLVLESGCVPLAVLEGKVDEWIASK